MFIKYARKGLSRTATVPSKRKHFHKNILAGSRSQKVEELKSVFYGGSSLHFGMLFHGFYNSYNICYFVSEKINVEF